MDIADWLRRLGLERYEQAFRDNAVGGEVLPSLTAEDLKDLGVTAVGHRRRLLDAIASLRAAAEPDRALAHRPEDDDEPAGERRQVVVLFADLAGYTALSRELDAEDVHALLGRFFERVDRVVEEHGGRVDKHLGDCVMAVFGAPLAHGNEAERAVRAALAVHDAMPSVAAEIGRAVDVHVGIAGGQVVASGTGSASHREYTVTGDSVNLAARLTDAARSGEILVSDAVRRALGDRLDGDELDPLRVKGFAEPVRAWRLRGLRAPSGRAALVGRAGELDRFRQALAECRATGRGRAILVRGEAGIGKTRLLEEFREEAHHAGFACHAGLVLDFGAGTGRDAVRALVRAMLGLTVSSDLSEAAAAAAGGLARGLLDSDDAVFLNDLLDLPQPTGLRALYDAMDPTTRDAGKRQAVSRLVERASRGRPLLLLVEDLHWADPSTVAHVARLARTVRRCSALLVMTSRSEGDPFDREAWRAEAGDEHAPLAMDLEPLDPAEARALAAPFLAANAALAECCVERAAGNPLFLEQLLRHAEESAEAGVPGSVQSLVQARLDRLDPADKTALQAASVLG
ncbi:MAG TPA: adenylate/guanylate cyclase domain-containing protein [Geminicoccaceae bacterium]|nr:adenylate/guanylate cyclase domain-containing protein [Geminicoccaceae bacterium]